MTFDYTVTPEDTNIAGRASTQFKSVMKELGVPAQVIRALSIAMYEGEINMVIHANGGKIHCEIDNDKITVTMKDEGPGIPDIEKAMLPGWSTASEEARELGFGAGMGLPNIKKWSSSMEVDSKEGVGTTLTMTFNI